jgi:hypothetical protein
MSAPSAKPDAAALVPTFKYPPHQIANIFPMLNPTSIEFRALVDDIKENGLREPITLYEDKVLDGRNRCLALQASGREIEKDNFRTFTGKDPIGFVLSANLHRRHLDESQRSMVGAALTELEVGANQHTKQGTSIDGASKLVNVGRASIERARVVLKSGDPKLIAQVQQGEVAVSAAADQVKEKKPRKKKEDDKTNTPLDRFEKAWDALELPDQEAFVETKYNELAKLMKEVDRKEKEKKAA